MKYQVEVGVRITDEFNHQTLGKTMETIEADDPAKALVKVWSDAGHNIATFFGMDVREQADILMEMARDRLFRIIRRWSRGE